MRCQRSTLATQRTYMGQVFHIGSARVFFVVYCDVLALLRFSTCLAEHFTDIYIIPLARGVRRCGNGR